MEHNNRGMRTKTINSVLQKKFNEWVETIEADGVRELVKKNTIITGGCIANMLLGEDVNDFDVYFANKETVLAVTNYYVGKFKELALQKHKNGRVIEIEVFEELERVKIYIKSAGIADEKGTSEYQYFENLPDEEGVDYVENVVAAITKADETNITVPLDKKYRPVFLSDNAITLSDKMQLIIRFYGNAETIHENYDFVHCTNYWLSDTGKIVLRQPALEALMARELIYIGSKYPVASLIRTRKFIKRGFVINAGQYLKMAFQISALDLTNIDVLKDQLVGVDVAYFNKLISILEANKNKETDKPLDINFQYIVTIIDRLF